MKFDRDKCIAEIIKLLHCGTERDLKIVLQVVRSMIEK